MLKGYTLPFNSVHYGGKRTLSNHAESAPDSLHFASLHLFQASVLAFLSGPFSVGHLGLNIGDKLHFVDGTGDPASSFLVREAPSNECEIHIVIVNVPC
jgi:hypothetical protein